MGPGNNLTEYRQKGGPDSRPAVVLLCCEFILLTYIIFIDYHDIIGIHIRR